jgi:dynein heavy chain
VQQAIKEGRKRFVFLGQDIRLIPSCGIFVTMNPGYAGEHSTPSGLEDTCAGCQQAQPSA